jgi:hypothetical protein
MLTGEIKRQINDIWNDFWTGGVSNPLAVRVNRFGETLLRMPTPGSSTTSASIASTTARPMSYAFRLNTLYILAVNH